MAKIPYENISNEFTKFSEKKQIPFIEYNGRQFADSNFIIDHLKQQIPSADLDNSLSDKERAQSRALKVLLEESVRWCVVYNRSKNNKFFASDKEGFGRHLSGAKKWLFVNIVNEQFRKKIVKAVYSQGIGRHSPAEVDQILMADLQALSTLLGSHHYFFGSHPTTLDATAFGHLCEVYYAPLLTDAVKKFMEERTPNLVEYLQRIKAAYWPDWDHCLQTLSLNKPSPAETVPNQTEEVLLTKEAA